MFKSDTTIDGRDREWYASLRFGVSGLYEAACLAVGGGRCSELSWRMAGTNFSKSSILSRKESAPMDWASERESSSLEAEMARRRAVGWRWSLRVNELPSEVEDMCRSIIRTSG